MPQDKLLFIFLDGFGLAPASDQNPMAVFNVLGDIIGTALTAEAATSTPDMVIKGLDATLGVPGIPQSATGQTALFTGVNAAKICGGHIPAYPPAVLQNVIKTDSLFKKAVESGLTATFANCYRDRYFELVGEGKRQHSVTTLSVMAANLALRTIADYHARSALFCDITGEQNVFPGAQQMFPITPVEAGERICRLCQQHDLVVFETFMPDVIGHKRDWDKAQRFCAVLNSFVETIVRKSDSRTTIVMTSDHGNFEDFSTGSHTKNPAVLCVFGPGSPYFNALSSIDQIPHAILRLLLRYRAQ